MQATRRAPSDAPPANIVVGVDFSSASEEALEAAIRKAKDWGTGLVLVHALTPLGAPGLDLGHPPFDPVRNESADVMASRPATADSWVARVRDAGVPVRLVTLSGAPARILIDEALRMQARAIVVGSHGNGAVRKAILGSVAQKVLDESPIPVLVIPETSQGASAA